MADDWIWVGVLLLLAVLVLLLLHFFKKWAKTSQPQYQQYPLPSFTRPTTSFPDIVISRDGMKIETMQDAGTIAPEEGVDCPTLLTRAETLTEEPGRTSQPEQQQGGFRRTDAQIPIHFALLLSVAHCCSLLIHVILEHNITI